MKETAALMFDYEKPFFLSQLFARMIADRAPAVKSLQETGEEVLKTADEDTKARIEEGLADVTRQWEELNDMTDSRKKALDVTMETAVKFDGLLADANKKIAAADEQLQAQQLGQKAEPEHIQEEAKKLQVSIQSFNLGVGYLVARQLGIFGGDNGAWTRF